tara:strand:- start:14957 stop:21586 length:6630 start_codon:yes stop_codon:yes gene_type:complete
MIQKIRESRIVKGILMFALLNFLGEMFAPSLSLALTGGPSQPEVESFTPIGSSDMVNLASGDFNYNIPLLDVGGYPINLAYNSGPTMDQEASWVGLGWNINPGAINRGKRGIPDDFNGEEIKTTKNLRPNITAGASIGTDVEIFGWDNFPIGLSAGLNWNNYNGYFITRSVAFNLNFGESNSFTTGLGLSSSTANGLTVSPSISYRNRADETDRKAINSSGSFTSNVGMSWNSRQGLQSMTIGLSKSIRQAAKIQDSRGGLSKVSGWSASVGGAMSFASSTYTPHVSHSMLNSSLSFTNKFGTDYFGLDPAAKVTGYFSMQNILNKEKTTKAYGYDYLKNGQNNEEAMLDFNREKDAAFVKGSPNLPLSSLTYDMFSVAGQGVAGQFRSFQSSVGHVFDQKVTSNGFGGQGGGEIGAGNLIKAGFDVSVNYSNSKSGKWRNNTNLASEQLSFARPQLNSDFEPTYFKNVGEPSADEDISRFLNLGGTDAIRVKLFKQGLVTKAAADYYGGGSINDNFKRMERSKRNQLISHLRKEEISLFGLNEYVSPHAKKDHIAEFKITKNDGSKYVYGLPAYNTSELSKTFNVGDKSDSGDGLVTYDNTDDSENNDKGLNHYYQSTEMPEYSHSHLLTAVLSSDYQDFDDIRGPSINDLGTYVKFSYDSDENQAGEQAAITDYKWRAPYQENKANFNEGLLSKNGDNVASYVYGTKDVWYVNKIETKTHIAVFHLSDREDSYEVKGEDGGIDAVNGRPLQKLDSISLYARPDFEENGTNATPIKKVHFEYTYELCKELPNNINGSGASSGKLTLKKVYFTYGNSHRGRLSSYNFNYDSNNPNYDMKAFDMWGRYKPYQGNAMSNAYFPYVDQYEDRSVLDSYATSWSLSSIELPSGGKIEITYEADDYQFVQNKQAEQMFDVLNLTSDNNYSENTNSSITELFDGSGNPYQFLWIELLPEDKTNGITSDEFKSKYLKGLSGESNIYFTFLMNLNSLNTIQDYVSGYAQVSNTNWYGVDVHNGNTYGYVRIKNVQEENTDCPTCPENAHPIAKATWQFIRSQVPQLLQVGNTIDGESVDETDLIEALITADNQGIITDLIDAFNGPNGAVRSKGLGTSFDASSSWIRLKNPNGKKVGGGSRVSKITVNDSWAAMVNSESESANTYSQEYIYTTIEGKSSGVATFEPLVSKENPFVQPKYFDMEKGLLPDERYMLEAPYGASFFPAPQVTYSRVVVQNTYPEDNSQSPNKTTPTERRTGRVVSSFYTSKDFPTIVKETNIKTVPLIGDNINLLNLLNLVVIEEHTVSQGYSIEKNNMNGVLKSRKVFAEGKTSPISGVEYVYKTNSKGKLDNNVSVVKKSGDVSTAMIGLDYDVNNDFRRNRTINLSGGIQINNNVFILPAPPPIFAIPYVVPTFYPSGSFEHKVFKSAVTTKIINRTGVLEEVIAFKDGASVSTKNVLWDSETGEVLLTQTKNEFDDDLYQMNFPAHWSYDEMGQAYRNLYIAMKGYDKVSQGVYKNGNLGVGTPQTSVSHYVSGDIVKVTDLSDSDLNYKAWVLDIDETAGEVTLIDKDGNLFDGPTSAAIKVIESGRENKQALAVGSITSKVSPVDPIVDRITDEYLSSTENRIINASAMEYSDHWSVQKGVVGECAHQLTSSGDGLLSLMNELIENNELGNGSVFSTVNVSTYNDFSALFDLMNNCSGYDCNIEYANCSNLSLQNGESQYNDRVLFRFDCLGSTGNCDYNNNYAFRIQPHSQFSMNSSYNFTNVESFFFDHSIYQQYQTPLIAKWADGTVIPLVVGSSECLETSGFVECEQPLICGIRAGDNINPFITNLRGAYRPYRSFVKLGDREQLRSDATTINTRENGYLNDFDYFWQNPENGEDWVATPNSDGVGENEWTWNSTITANVGYNQNGMEQENKDALYRYSSSIFGYQDKLPIAIAKNASKGKIGFDGFEDYDFYPSYDGCAMRHFSFDAHRSKIVENESHSGRHSVKLVVGDEISMTRQLVTAPCNDNGYGYPNFGNSYIVSACEMYNLFGPETYDRAAHEKSVFEGSTPVLQPKQNKYVVSYWVKQENQGSSMSQDFSSLTPIISVDQTVVSLSNLRKSNVIDGWQKIEYTFDIQGYSTTVGDKTISVAFKNVSGEIKYIDDIRIQPYNSSMKTYVYDPINFRLTAELDDNNFATFYEYDQEGKLIRVKKETERGIMTIQETRNHTQITN